jgi:uncharacterized membrane protein
MIPNYEKPRTAEQNRKLWQVANELGLDQEQIGDLAWSFSSERTRSTKELTIRECNELIEYLAGRLSEGKKAMRGKIIHLLCTLPESPMVDSKGAADFERINTFIQNIGSNNPKKKILNYLYYQELVPVVSQVQAMYDKQMKSLTK